MVHIAMQIHYTYIEYFSRNDIYTGVLHLSSSRCHVLCLPSIIPLTLPSSSHPPPHPMTAISQVYPNYRAQSPRLRAT